MLGPFSQTDPMAAYYVITRTFYALQDMRTPVTIGAAMIVLNAILDYLLMQVMGVAGIALATALVTFVNVGLLIGALGRRVGGLEGRRIASTAARVTLATGAALGAAVLVLQFVHAAPGSPVIHRLLVLGAGIGAGAVTYLGACLLLRVEELSLLKDLIRRR